MDEVTKSWIRHPEIYSILQDIKLQNDQARTVTFVINTLKELYPTIPIPLDHKDPYTLLIAVFFLQCTDVRGIKLRLYFCKRIILMI
jgi:hypothetical protein